MEKLDLKFLLYDTRARVYLMWASIVAIGYTATHFYQNPNINFLWTVLSVIGLFYMYRVMPLGVVQMQRIFAAWLVPIIVGMSFSVLSARGYAFDELVSNLGAFWLLITAVGFVWNGLVDRPAAWYMAGGAICVAGASLIYFNSVFWTSQYLVAGIVSVWAMLNLFIFRTD